MRAMILSAGIGSRLKEITQSRPKALVEVKGKPIVHHIIDSLISSGIDSIVINLHHFPEQIKSYIESQDFSIKFYFTHEEELLDSGGAIKNAREFLEQEEEFLVCNCDIYTNYDFTRIINTHSKKDLATIVTSPATSDRVLLFDKDKSLIGWKTQDFSRIVVDTKEQIPLNYNCIALINSNIFKYFDMLNTKFSIFDVYLLAVENNEKVRAVELGDSNWTDIGTIDDLNRVNK